MELTHTENWSTVVYPQKMMTQCKSCYEGKERRESLTKLIEDDQQQCEPSAPPLQPENSGDEVKPQPSAPPFNALE